MENYWDDYPLGFYKDRTYCETCRQETNGHQYLRQGETENVRWSMVEGVRQAESYPRKIIERVYLCNNCVEKMDSPGKRKNFLLKKWETAKTL